MRRAIATLAIALAAAGSLATAAPPAKAEVGFPWVAPWKLATPKCRDHPHAPVVGRVAGMLGFESRRSVSFVGCFPSFAACYAWQQPLSGRFAGRLIVNSCDRRV